MHCIDSKLANASRDMCSIVVNLKSHKILSSIINASDVHASVTLSTTSSPIPVDLFREFELLVLQCRPEDVRKNDCIDIHVQLQNI